MDESGDNTLGMFQKTIWPLVSKTLIENGALKERVTALKDVAAAAVAEVAPLKETIVNLRMELKDANWKLKNALVSSDDLEKTLKKTKDDLAGDLAAKNDDLEKTKDDLKRANELVFQKNLKCDKYKNALAARTSSLRGYEKTLDKTKGDLKRASELLKQAREFGWRKKLECDNYKRQLQEFKGAIIPLKEFAVAGWEPRATYRCPNFGKEGCTYDGVNPRRHKCKCTSSSSSSKRRRH
jgi:chromosome segregation ATPase